MKLGIVSDLHCNIDGLDRALETMGPIDALLCLGDSIYEYSFSNAVIGRLRALDALTILGNHEEVFLGPAGVRARPCSACWARWLSSPRHAPLISSPLTQPTKAAACCSR